MDPSNGLSPTTTPTDFYSQIFSGFIFLALETWATWSVLFPRCPQFIHTQRWDNPVCQLPCRASPLPWLPSSSPPTSLDECFFFNSLVFRLRYSLIFWQFWLCFVFKLVVVLLSVVQGESYLPTPKSYPETCLSTQKFHYVPSRANSSCHQQPLPNPGKDCSDFFHLNLVFPVLELHIHV